jgi:hypothetical protein
VWHNLAKAIREFERTFGDAFSSYRPELHYMRGPGPKFRAKRARNATNITPATDETAHAVAGIAEAHA